MAYVHWLYEDLDTAYEGTSPLGCEPVWRPCIRCVELTPAGLHCNPLRWFVVRCGTCCLGLHLCGTIATAVLCTPPWLQREASGRTEAVAAAPRIAGSKDDIFGTEAGKARK